MAVSFVFLLQPLYPTDTSHVHSTFLFTSLSFSALLLSTLYFVIRRRKPIATLTTSFDEVDWAMYATRPVRKTGKTVAMQKFRDYPDAETTPTRREPQPEVFVVVDDQAEAEERQKKEQPLIGGAF